MTANSLGQIARRAFYEGMKGGAHSDALWEAAAGAVAEMCADSVRRMRWGKDSFPMRATTWSQEDAHAAIALALEGAVTSICDLKVSPVVEATTEEGASS